jgi:hypothetical protein
MTLEKIRSLYDQEQRREVIDPAMRREATGAVVRLVDLHGTQSCVIYSRLGPDQVEAAVREQIRYFQRLGHSFEWKAFSHDTPADLKERLVACGGELEETEAVLVLDLNQLPAALTNPIQHEVRRITEPEGLRDVAAIQKAVGGVDDKAMEERLVRELREQPERTSIYVAYMNGTPAAAGRLNFDPASRFASLWGGKTAVIHRRKGLFTALVAIRAQEAKRRGARFLTVDARPMSRPILERNGFQLLTFANALHWPRK